MHIRAEALPNIISEFAVRCVLAIIAIHLDRVQPFARKIHPDELWLYKNPMTTSYVTTFSLWIVVLVLPSVTILLVYWIQRKGNDLLHAMLAWSLAWLLNAALTNTIKVVAGRPRPDFFWRCFPNGIVSTDLNCTGNEAIINEGRKSFPSGHSSWAFASMGFLSFYLAGKLHTFSANGKSQAWRLMAVLVPLFIALAIALSRTCDYHHHWQDVVCGSGLGLACAYLCYRHYFPSLSSAYAHKPYANIPVQALQKSDLDDVKWI